MAQLIRVSPPGLCRVEHPRVDPRRDAIICYLTFHLVLYQFGPLLILSISRLLRSCHWPMETTKIRWTRLVVEIPLWTSRYCPSAFYWYELYWSAQIVWEGPNLEITDNHVINCLIIQAVQVVSNNIKSLSVN